MSASLPLSATALVYSVRWWEELHIYDSGVMFITLTMSGLVVNKTSPSRLMTPPCVPGGSLLRTRLWYSSVSYQLNSAGM